MGSGIDQEKKQTGENLPGGKLSCIACAHTYNPAYCDPDYWSFQLPDLAGSRTQDHGGLGCSESSISVDDCPIRSILVNNAPHQHIEYAPSTTTHERKTLQPK